MEYCIVGAIKPWEKQYYLTNELMKDMSFVKQPLALAGSADY